MGTEVFTGFSLFLKIIFKGLDVSVGFFNSTV